MNNLDMLTVNSIRNLSIDMVEKANSGHPGMAMGAAPIMYALWKNHLKVSPKHDKWLNRDRYVLSAGHASPLLYSTLHLAGFDLSMDELKRFRQFGSITPGHPEYGMTPGVDATTGPLGQGFAMAVGMAVAETHLNATYNKPGFNIVDHHTYIMCGDGDMAEGITGEAASFAGHNKLGKLIAIYDANDVTLDGDLSRSFSEDVKGRFESYGWEVNVVEDGTDTDAISEAIDLAKNNIDKPSLIIVKTVIGYGSPNKSGSSKVHGSPLGETERQLTRENLKWTYGDFEIPEEAYSNFNMVDAGEQLFSEWKLLIEKYKETYPELHKQLFESKIEEINVDFEPKPLATRESGGKVLEALVKHNKNIIGGSADLSSSNKTYVKEAGDFTSSSYTGRNIWYGVREFAMGAIMNGIQLHGGLHAFGSTFLVFSDYVRPAIRLSALMRLPVTYIFTHDSIAVGEDGPTHEPIEHLQSLRLIPNVSVMRPADSIEANACMNEAFTATTTPSVIALTRQNLPALPLDRKEIEAGVKKGAYFVKKYDNATGVIYATGSEVSLALDVSNALLSQQQYINVVSIPQIDKFESQSQDYIKSIMMPNITNRLVIEMGVTRGWERFAPYDAIYGINRFGESAPADILLKEFGFDTDKVVDFYSKKYL